MKACYKLSICQIISSNLIAIKIHFANNKNDQETYSHK